ncbi:MAG: 4'-phosphopantetheinyl transferase superfamily protein [Synechococcaceae cyanobacterium]|nr:4'-phosphopantetheinyl transferase superfamily protein [Synechococcaceae cyanobacterium]
MEQSLGVCVVGAAAPVQLAITCLAIDQPASRLAVLSEAELRWSAALPSSTRRRYRHSRALLRHWLAPQLGCEAGRLPLHSPPGEAPRLERGWGWVSLSHSGSGLLLAWSAAPVGVDLEHSQRRFASEALARRFFPAAEFRQLAGLEAEALRQAVLHSWVLKEAAVKCCRGSLARDLAALRFDHQARQLWRDPDRAALPARGGRLGKWLWGAVGDGVEELHWQAAALEEPQRHQRSEVRSRLRIPGPAGAAAGPEQGLSWLDSLL